VDVRSSFNTGRAFKTHGVPPTKLKTCASPVTEPHAVLQRTLASQHACPGQYVAASCIGTCTHTQMHTLNTVRRLFTSSAASTLLSAHARQVHAKTSSGHRYALPFSCFEKLDERKAAAGAKLDVETELEFEC
jgi:hypothetical protein